MIGFEKEDWDKLKKSKDPLVQKIVDMWDAVFKNPAFDMFIAHKIQTDKWSEETKKTPASLKSRNDNGSNKEFEYAFKFMLESLELAKTQKSLQDMLLPEEVKLANEQVIEFQGGLEQLTDEIYKNSKKK